MRLNFRKATSLAVALKLLLGVHWLFPKANLMLVNAGDFPDDACDSGTPECIPLPNSPCCTSYCRLRPAGSPCASQGVPSLSSLFSTADTCHGVGGCSGTADLCVVPTVAELVTPCKLTPNSATTDGQCVAGFCEAPDAVNYGNFKCNKSPSLGVCCAADGTKLSGGVIPPYSVSTIHTAPLPLANTAYPNYITIAPVAAECTSTGSLSSYVCLNGEVKVAATNGQIIGGNAYKHCGRGLGVCAQVNALFEINCKLVSFWSACKPALHKTADECQDLVWCNTSPLPSGLQCSQNQECSTTGNCDGTLLQCQNVKPKNEGGSCRNGLGKCVSGKCQVANPCDDVNFVNYCSPSSNVHDQQCCVNCIISPPSTLCALDKPANDYHGKCNAGTGTCVLNQLCNTPIPPCTTGTCCNKATCDYATSDTTCATNLDVCKAITCTGSTADCPLTPNSDGKTCSVATDVSTITSGVCKSGSCTCDPSKDSCCDPASNMPKASGAPCTGQCYACDGKSSTCPLITWVPNQACSGGRICGATVSDGCKIPAPQPSMCDPSTDLCCDPGTKLPVTTTKICGTKECYKPTMCDGSSATCPPPTVWNANALCAGGICGQTAVDGCKCHPSTDLCCNPTTILPMVTMEFCGTKDCYTHTMCDGTSATCPPQTVWNANTACTGGTCGSTPADGCVKTIPPPCEAKTDKTPCTLPLSYVPKFGLSHDGECNNGACVSICETRGICANPGGECCNQDCQPQVGLACSMGGTCSARGTCEQEVCPLLDDVKSGTTFTACECLETLTACQVCCEPLRNFTSISKDPRNLCKAVAQYGTTPQDLTNAGITQARTVINAGSQCLTYGQCDTTGGLCLPNLTAITTVTKPVPDVAVIAAGGNTTKKASPALLTRVAYIAARRANPPYVSFTDMIVKAAAMQAMAIEVFRVVWGFCQGWIF